MFVSGFLTLVCIQIILLSVAGSKSKLGQKFNKRHQDSCLKLARVEGSSIRHTADARVCRFYTGVSSSTHVIGGGICLCTSGSGPESPDVRTWGLNICACMHICIFYSAELCTCSMLSQTCWVVAALRTMNCFVGSVQFQRFLFF